MPAAAGVSSRFCDRTVPLTVAQQDRLLRFAAVVRDELHAGGAPVALISRSGLDLSRFGIRYSHAGLSLQRNEAAPWAVRQLYFSCEEKRPRLYDQGVAGFVTGTDDPDSGFISLLLLDGPEAAALEAAALDRPLALQLLAATYSANAYAYGLAYQNCNQWVMELIASAWGGLAPGESLRSRSQDWLAANGYEAGGIDVGSRWVMAAAAFIPWVRLDDHPEADRQAMRLHITMPASIETFVRRRVPGARRIEICHDAAKVVVRRGGEPIEAGCVAREGDRVVDLL